MSDGFPPAWWGFWNVFLSVCGLDQGNFGRSRAVVCCHSFSPVFLLLWSSSSSVRSSMRRRCSWLMIPESVAKCKSGLLPPQLWVSFPLSWSVKYIPGSCLCLCIFFPAIAIFLISLRDHPNFHPGFSRYVSQSLRIPKSPFPKTQATVGTSFDRMWNVGLPVRAGFS